MAENWCLIESDPGVFTELIGQIGAKDVQVEELYDMSDEMFKKISPVYGLIFLFKYGKEKPKSDKVVPAANVPGLWFANQVINNACATQAIVSVLLNRDEINLGDTLREFKGFTGDFTPDMRGLALSNSKAIREAHNSFARPEPFQIENVKTESDDDEVYHFVAYIPHNGGIYELDGLQAGPIRHGDATKKDWLQKVRPIIQARMAGFQKEGKREIRFNLLALIKNLKERYQEEIDLEMGRKMDYQSRLLDDEDQMDVDGESCTKDQLKAKVAACDSNMVDLRQKVKDEEAKFERWRVENIRRKHNYIPFIFNLLRKLADKGMLEGLVKDATEVKKKKLAEKKAEEEKTKEKTEKKADEEKEKPKS